MAEVPVPAVGPEASAASVHGWLTVVSTAASSCLGEGEMLESRILCKTGAQHGVQQGGVTLKKSVSKPLSAAALCSGSVVCREGFCSIGPFVVMSRLSRPNYIFVKELGE